MERPKLNRHAPTITSAVAWEPPARLFAPGYCRRPTVLSGDDDARSIQKGTPLVRHRRSAAYPDRSYRTAAGATAPASELTRDNQKTSCHFCGAIEPFRSGHRSGRLSAAKRHSLGDLVFFPRSGQPAAIDSAPCGFGECNLPSSTAAAFLRAVRHGCGRCAAGGLRHGWRHRPSR